MATGQQMRVSVDMQADATGLISAARAAAAAVDGIATAANQPAGSGLDAVTQAARQSQTASAQAETAARQLAAEQARAAQAAERAQQMAAAAAQQSSDAYAALRASLDPAVAAQQRYERALAVVRQAQAAASADAGNYAETLTLVERQLSPTALAAQRAEAEARDLGRAFAALEESLDPSTAASRRHAQALEVVEAAYRAGIVGADNYAATVAQINAQMAPATGQVRLAAHQWTNLGYQMQDVVVQLAGGQNPFLILAQQGPQATGAVGGVANAMALLRGALFSAAGVASLAVAAIAAVGLAADHAAGEMRAIGLAQATAAKPLGDTTAALYHQSAAWADAAGVSRAAGREMLRAGISSGLTKEAIASLTLASRDLAVVTGVDAATAFADFAGQLGDPARAIDELNKRYGLLSAAETQHARNLTASGRSSEATALLTDKLSRRFKSLNDTALSPLERVWAAIARNASNAGNAMAEAALAYVDPRTDRRATPELVADRADTRARLTATEAQPGGIARQAAARYRADLAELDRELATRRRAGEQAAILADLAAANARGRATADLASQINPSTTTIQTRSGQITALETGLATGTGMSAEQIAQATVALERLRLARDTYISDADRAVAAAQIEAVAAGKLGVERDLYVARAQAELEMRGQELSGSERAARLRAAEAQVYAQAAQAQTDRLHGLSAEIDLESRLAQVAGQGAAARRQAEADARVYEAGRQGGPTARAGQRQFEDLKEGAVSDRIRADQTAQIEKQTTAENLRVRALLAGEAATRETERAEQVRLLALEEGTAGSTKYADAVAHYTRLLADQDRAGDTERLIGLTGQSAFATARLQQELDELQRLRPLAQLLADSGQLPGALAAVDDQIKQTQLSLREAELASAGWAGGAELAALRLEQGMGSAAEQSAQLWGQAYSSLGDAAAQWATTGRLSGKNLVDGLKAEAARLATTRFVVNIAASVSSSAAGSFLSGTLGKIGDFIGGFFATGGRPPVGRASVIGEAGPELWVPDQAGTVVANHDIAAWLAAQGRGGDSLVAHVNPREAALLKRLGGAGTVNPRTGLLEFYDDYMDGSASYSQDTYDSYSGRSDGGDYDSDASSAGAGRGTLGYSASGATFGYDPNSAVGAAAIETITETLESDSFGDALIEALTPVVATTKYDPATGGVATTYDFDIGAAIGGLLGSIFGGPIGGLIGGQLGSGVLGSVPLGSASGVAGARIGAALTGDERESYSDALAATVQTLAEQTGATTTAIQQQIDLLAKWALQISELNPRISEADKITADARASMANLKTGIDEVVKAATDADGADMGAAAKQQALAMVQLAASTSAVQQPLSDTAKQLATVRAEAAEYALLLKELGSDTTAAQLGLDRTMADLRSAFEGNLRDALLTPAEREFAELTRQQAERLADARAVGADLVLVEQVAAAERKSFLESLADDQRAIFLGLESAADGLLSSLDAIQAGAATAVDQQLELARTAAQSARQAADAYLDTADRLAKSLADARTGRLSPFSRQQQLAESQQRFDTAASAAQGGDVAAAQGLAALREDLLSSAQAVYGSTGAYAQIFTQSEAAAAQAMAAAAALGAVGSADADGRDQIVAALEVMQSELRGEADAGRLQQQLDALAVLDGRLAALHDVTLVQTSTLATGLTSAQMATDAVAARLAGGVGIVSAPSIAADLTQVQAALTGNNSAEAGAVRAAIAVLTGTTADGLIDAAEAEPTRAAIEAMRVNLAALAGATNVAVNTSTGQIVRLGDLTASQIAAILAGDRSAADLLGDVSGAVVTQTGEVRAGNTLQAALTGLTGTNNELIRQLTGGNNALVGAQNLTTDTIRAGNTALTTAINALLKYQSNTAQADQVQQQLASLIADRQGIEAERQALQPALSLASAAVQQQAAALAVVQQRDAAVGVAARDLDRTRGVTGRGWTTYNTATNQIDGYYGASSEPDANVTRSALRALDYARSLGLADIAGRVSISGYDAGATARLRINGQEAAFAETDAAGLTQWVVEQLNAAVGGISADTLAAQNWAASAASMQSTLAALQGQLATQSAADATLAAQIAAATASEQQLRQQIAQLLSVPGYATGTTSSVGGLALLGEEGPELVTQPGYYRLRAGSQVLTAGQTRALAARAPAFGGSGGGVDLSPLLAELAALRRDNAEMRGLLARGVQVGERQVEGIGAVARQTAGVASAINRQPLTAARANISYGGRR